jgi:ClpP class serine protease
MNAARYARQSLIKEIETQTGTTLICYVAGTGQQINRQDTLGMVDLLHNIPTGSNIDLLLHSPGGDIDAAEKLVGLIRRRAGRIRVIVPDFAKSAATLIALGADEIVMSDTSELGAIDPQIDLVDANGNPSVHSAQNYIDAYEKHVAALGADPGDPVAQIMLNKMEPATVRKLERIMTRSRAIATDLLRTRMIRDEETAEETAKSLADTERWHSHGQVISHEIARGLGLNITYLPGESEEWIRYWRLYCLQIYTVDGAGRLFESSYASLPM